MPADSTAAFSDMFQQNPNVRLASYNAVDAQPVDLTQAAENSVHAVGTYSFYSSFQSSGSRS